MPDKIKTLLIHASGPPTRKGVLAYTSLQSLPLKRFYFGALKRITLFNQFLNSYDRMSYIGDWRTSFERHQKLGVESCDLRNLLELRRILKRIKSYELIVVLHSAVGDAMDIPNLLAPKLQDRKGKLLVLFGNEYDLMPQKLAFLKAAQANFIGTQLPIESGRWLYDELNSFCRTLEAPHALNTERFFSLNLDRRVDLGFRGDWHGDLYWLGDIERARYLQHLQLQSNAYGVSADIEFCRLDANAWQIFLNQCKGIPGAESGTTFLQRTDETKKKVLEYMAGRPSATFEDVYDRFFRNLKDYVSGRAVSSRHFEAVGTQTCQVLLEGQYNNILKPDQHYIAVKRDLSNLGEALRRLSDENERQRIVQQAHSDITSHHTYRHRIDYLIGEMFERS